MNLMQREDELDCMISNALHEIADNSEIPERVKQEIDEQIADRNKVEKPIVSIWFYFFEEWKFYLVS